MIVKAAKGISAPAQVFVAATTPAYQANIYTPTTAPNERDIILVPG